MISRAARRACEARVGRCCRRWGPTRTASDAASRDYSTDQGAADG